MRTVRLVLLDYVVDALLLYHVRVRFFFFFFFNDTATTEIYTLSLHDALPICRNEYRAVKKRDAAAARNGQYKKQGALPQRELVSIKSGGAAATRNGHYKKRGRCRRENR